MTPGPWRWVADDAGPDDEYGCSTPGVIDPRTFKSPGFAGNPILYGGGPLDDYANRIISAGAGEYNPFNRPEDAVAIAAVPDLIDALTVAHRLLVGLLTDNQLDFVQPDGLSARQRIAGIEAALTKAKGEAVPEVLAALERSLDWLASYPGGGAVGAYEQARAALAKAEGKE